VNHKIFALYALEQLSGGGSCVHRLHPRAKLFAALIFIVTVVSFDRYALERLAPYIFYPALLTALSETPQSMLFKRFLIALPFCLFAGAGNVLFDRAAAFTAGGFAVSFGALSLATIILRTYLCVTAVLLLVATTPFASLTREMRRAKCPPVFITMFEMTYRYIGVLLCEAYTMSAAYSLRSANRKRSAARTAPIAPRDMGSFAGQLLLRSFARAERVYRAMKCRGYHSRAQENRPRDTAAFCARDIVFLSGVFSCCVIFRAFDVNAFAAALSR
jgi:cobalt/nickel transport system permease protein